MLRLSLICLLLVGCQAKPDMTGKKLTDNDGNSVVRIILIPESEQGHKFVEGVINKQYSDIIAYGGKAYIRMDHDTLATLEPGGKVSGGVEQFREFVDKGVLQDIRIKFVRWEPLCEEMEQYYNKELSGKKKK
jgi:hypothetical protein